MSPRVAGLASTKTGLRIGLAHTPCAYKEVGHYGLLLQRALLEPRTAKPLSLVTLALGKIWNWL